MPSMQPTEHPRTSPPGSRVSEHMPLYPSCVHLPEWAVSQAIATGDLEARNFTLERTRRIGQAWAVIHVTDQLLTPCSKYFSGASTLNGTPGGDRWARVLGGQIGWLSEPLHRFETDCSGSCNLKCELMESTKKSRSTENTPRNPYQPSDRDHLETDREETRPTRCPILARFYRYRVCGNRSRTALAISKNDECYTQTDRHTHTYRQTN